MVKPAIPEALRPKPKEPAPPDDTIHLCIFVTKPHFLKALQENLVILAPSYNQTPIKCHVILDNPTAKDIGHRTAVALRELGLVESHQVGLAPHIQIENGWSDE